MTEDRRIAPRHRAQLDAELRTYLLIDESEDADLDEEMHMLGARTYDVSRSGIGLIVPHGSVDGRRLSVVIGRSLQIVLEIPLGTIAFEATAVRYELIKEEGQVSYLIGAHISDIDDQDRERYDQFIASVE